jgi:hypothetical protein
MGKAQSSLEQGHHSFNNGSYGRLLYVPFADHMTLKDK